MGKTDTATLTQLIAAKAMEKKAEDLCLLDIRSVVGHCTDFFVICSSSSVVHAQSIYEHLVREVYLLCGLKPYSVEGTREKKWILADYVDVVVHIMQQEARSFYQLEQLWGQGKQVYLADGK